MSSTQEHHDEAERLLALVRADVGDDYRGAADHVPTLLVALVHATLATSATRPASRDRIAGVRFHPAEAPADPGLLEVPEALQVPDSIFQEDPGPE